MDSERLKTIVPRFNVAPTQNVWVIHAGHAIQKGSHIQNGSLSLAEFRWGLVPSWAKDLSIGSSMINARRESLPEKRSFKGPLASRRCVVLADGYYEWSRVDPRNKQAYWISSANQPLLLLAALWERNTQAAPLPTFSCTIITTAANQAMATIHDRMPMPLKAETALRWLNTGLDLEQAYQLLEPVRGDYFQPQRVSNYVNNACHEGPECLAMQA
jgi:putative SOS response-associated peptidase YedK